jgi:hypothetical protein
MDERKAQNILLVVFGIAILWVGWGNLLALLLPGGHPCSPPGPEGLHLDSTLQLVYANEQCSVVVYEYAWLTFLSLSALGLAAVISGWHRMRGTNRPD